MDRKFSGTRNVQQQEASHNAEIFVKAIQAGDLIRTCYCPIVMPNKRSSQRVKKHKQSRRTRERADARTVRGQRRVARSWRVAGICRCSGPRANSRAASGRRDGHGRYGARLPH